MREYTTIYKIDNDDKDQDSNGNVENGALLIVHTKPYAL